METELLYALRDPAGIPSHPVIFLVLGVLTFALHIAAVQMMLGASTLTLWGAFSRDAHRRRLAQSMINVAKVMVSVAIVLGVAPLLFVQVIYDPFWYTANVLSAWWVIGFILILLVGYTLMYVFYWRNHHLADTARKPSCPGAMVASIALLLVVGFIMHVLSQQMLQPEQWMSWYAPNGDLETRGTALHAFHPWRFLFFISLSAPVTGALLVAYQRYFRARDDVEPAYLDWVRDLAYRLINVGGVVALVLGAVWMATLPEAVAGFAFSPWVWVSAAGLLGFVGFAHWVRGKGNSPWAYAVLGVGTVAIILVAVAREALRWAKLHGVHGYNALDYPINMDWYSTLTFFVTFGVMGAGVLAYYLTVAWRAGQTQGVYTASAVVDRMGNIAIAMLVLWIVHYFVLGFVWWAL
ncbi:hypothetical protein [Thioalkalivibrio sulfidiphilus]|uniref:Uncharacterized protein n=1 Tax=Thioalkalivibrio sulfidiphilus (strain HL-EbGR7) TaxID=396588 RepID=B8GME4_THISH|nr:hypothetical protein [Thioalkalivibrio sulfidiphilus]ACL71776.1 conserved hypothetical protein [Thioalkalivibrio sulfidiphilus HL-EbGr7]